MMDLKSKSKSKRSPAIAAPVALLLAALTLICLWAPHARADFNMKTDKTPTLPRDLSVGYFKLQVKVEGVEPEDAQKHEGETSYFYSRIKIFLPSVSAAQIKNSDVEDTDVGFYAKEYQDYTFTTNPTTNKIDFVFYIAVREKVAGKLKEAVGTSKSIRVKLNYEDAGAKTSKKIEGVEFTVVQDLSVPNEAPVGLQTDPAHRSILFSWSAASAISYYDGVTVTSKDPTDVVAVAIKRSAGAISIPARQLNTSATEDTETSCTYNPTHPDPAACVTCQGANTYLDLDAIANDANFSIQEVDGTGGDGQLVNLAVEEYSILLTYSGGLKWSSCNVETPGINKTIAELNGAEEGKPTNLYCFVATAAYGDPLKQEVRHFRWFRNHVLAKMPAGRIFIRAYYRYGPRAAQFIEEHSWAKAATRRVLTPIASAISWWRQHE